ncbi:hypothetical protein NLJ89_g3777 [Agrocybe chaxingu]|uniref:Domain of unknown function at the cortex 1 domain-containing protein n=1 Tax=Agrocybe chaxingu TaxID=84603 RepID=A0A9W8K3C1_9AGAR|nr:hypothetical protein NLJ89_g3777 [Agrocybe chaxingu]
MAPRLRVLAGTSTSAMVPMTSLVNTSTPFKLSSDVFEGQIVAHIKGLTDEHGELRDSDYFNKSDRKGVTWSIQVQGRFLIPHSADDILFGNTFDRPLKLPWGTGAVLKFMHYIDPTLEHDLMSSTSLGRIPTNINDALLCACPCAEAYSLSILVFLASLSPSGHMSSQNCTASSHGPVFPPTQSIQESTSELYLAIDSTPSSPSSSSSGSTFTDPSPESSATSLSSSRSGKSECKDRLKYVMKKTAKRSRSSSQTELELQQFTTSSQRRSYFSAAEKRKLVKFGPEDLITTDFCYGFINFAPSLSLQLPGGLSFDLARYWDGQPVRFMCCQRKTEGDEGGDPWGRVFWCIAIEMVTDEDEE